MKEFCFEKEKIENYELAKADNFKGWEIHHRLETHTSDGIERPVKSRISVAELKALGMYYNRPASELIYLRKSEHVSLHFKGHKKFGKGGHLGPHSKETKDKIRITKSHKVICLETKEIFSSIKEAGEKYHTSHISKAVNGIRKTAAGFHWALLDA